MTDGDSMTMNHLCNSANGTFVTLDDYLPITHYEGNHDRFLRDPVYRGLQLKIGWSEQKCIEMDKLAQEDHSRGRDVSKRNLKEFTIAFNEIQHIVIRNKN